jgi:hypothetical protein
MWVNGLTLPVRPWPLANGSLVLFVRSASLRLLRELKADYAGSVFGENVLNRWDIYRSVFRWWVLRSIRKLSSRAHFGASTATWRMLLHSQQ